MFCMSSCSDFNQSLKIYTSFDIHEQGTLSSITVSPYEDTAIRIQKYVSPPKLVIKSVNNHKQGIFGAIPGKIGMGYHLYLKLGP